VRAAAPAPPPPTIAAPPYPGATFTPVATSPLSTVPQQRTCDNCGTSSDPTRRFCRRCGTWLVTPTLVAPAPPETLGRRLRRRWWGGTTGAYSGDLTRSTIAFRVLSVIIAVAVVAVVLGVAGLHPIREATDALGHVLGSGRVAGVTAQADPGDALPGHPASWAVDDVRGRGFATRWTAPSPGDPNSACANPAPASATASSLVLTFPAPTNVREIGIEAGLPADDRDRTARWRPRALELHWSDGACQHVTLADIDGLQRFTVEQSKVNGGKVSSVRVVVVAGYPPANGGSDRLDIGEITFWQRGISFFWER
jgi:hypothetical protein